MISNFKWSSNPLWLLFLFFTVLKKETFPSWNSVGCLWLRSQQLTVFSIHVERLKLKSTRGNIFLHRIHQNESIHFMVHTSCLGQWNHIAGDIQEVICSFRNTSTSFIIPKFLTWRTLTWKLQTASVKLQFKISIHGSSVQLHDHFFKEKKTITTIYSLY